MRLNPLALLRGVAGMLRLTILHERLRIKYRRNFSICLDVFRQFSGLTQVRTWRI